MEQTAKPKKLWKKRLLTAAAVVAAVVLVLLAAVFALWHNEIFSLASMTLIRERDDAHLDGAVYFITGKITKGLVKMNISETEIACSSFTAAAEDGSRLFARNYDFSKTNTCIVRTQANKGRHASISTVDLQFLGLDVEKDVDGLANRITCLAVPYIPLDGVNDAGVACGIYMTYQGGDSVPTDQRTAMTSTTRQRPPTTTWWPTPAAGAPSWSGWGRPTRRTPTGQNGSWW